MKYSGCNQYAFADMEKVKNGAIPPIGFKLVKLSFSVALLAAKVQLLINNHLESTILRRGTSCSADIFCCLSILQYAG